MTKTATTIAAAFLAAVITTPAWAQGAAGGSSGTASQAQSTEEPRPSRRSSKRDGASKREMTVKGMAAGERRKKCSAEWKEAKAAGKTNGLRWPKFYSQCNARLKGSSA
jgi:hypothetical protein